LSWETGWGIDGQAHAVACTVGPLRREQNRRIHLLDWPVNSTVSFKIELLSNWKTGHSIDKI
jgi:hypothetical protein